MNGKRAFVTIAWITVGAVAGVAHADDLPPYVELAWVAAGHGTVIYGKAAGDEMNVASAEADFNGDGVNDLVLAAADADRPDRVDAGEVYVIFGPIENGITFDLETLDGSNGFVVHGASANARVFAASSPGRCDVNGDGTDDLLAASGSVLGGAGQSYVVFGRESFPPTFDLAELDGENGFALTGKGPEDFASRLECAGDTNGDGFDDLVIGAPDGGDGSKKGEAYLVLGREAFEPEISLNAARVPDGMTFRGTTKDGEFGDAVSGAGDVNGDGLDDFLIGAPKTERLGARTGVAYLYLGRQDFIPDGTGRTPMYGEEVFDNAGSDVAAAGDVNGDGYDDLLIGVWEKDFGGFSRAGAVYLIYGGPEPPVELDLADVGSTIGVGIFGGNSFNYLGNSLARGADLNGDGYADIIAGAQNQDPWGKDSGGAAYVVFGGPDLPSEIVVGELDGTDGFRIHGETEEDRAGGTLTAGDLNGDGRDDLVVGAVFAGTEGRAKAGAAYILFEPVAPPVPWVVLPPREVEP